MENVKNEQEKDVVTTDVVTKIVEDGKIDEKVVKTPEELHKEKVLKQKQMYEERSQYIKNIKYQLEVLRLEKEFSMIRYEKLRYDYDFDKLRETVQKFLEEKKLEHSISQQPQPPQF